MMVRPWATRASGETVAVSSGAGSPTVTVRPPGAVSVDRRLEGAGATDALDDDLGLQALLDRLVGGERVVGAEPAGGLELVRQGVDADDRVRRPGPAR